MLPLLKRIKEGVEKISGSHIYRNTLPHGLDCFFDIGRRFGRNDIKVVFDVGANIGQSALVYLHQFPQAEIYSFEPVPGTYHKLVAATEKFARIHSYQLGMGREPGRAAIHVNKNSAISSILPNNPEDHTEPIELESIDHFAQKQNLAKIDFLKVDTEGYDLEVLAGASHLLQRQKIRYVFCECEPVVRTRRYASYSALAEFLGSFGYLPFGVYDQQPDQLDWLGKNSLLYWNALFLCEELANHTTKS